VIAAREAEARLKTILDEAERTGHLDSAALQQALAAAGESANALRTSFETWRRAHPEISASNVAPSPASPPPVRRVNRPPASESKQIPTAELPLAAPRDTLFDTVMEVWTDTRPDMGGGRWKRFPGSLTRPFVLRASGQVQLDFETSDQRTALGSNGAPTDAVNSSSRMAARLGVRLEPSMLASPDSPYAALLARICGENGCEEARRFQDGVFEVCPRSSAWLELRINEPVVKNDWSFYRHADGRFVVRPTAMSGSACSAQ
jgi:hypothetical protein